MRRIKLERRIEIERRRRVVRRGSQAEAQFADPIADLPVAERNLLPGTALARHGEYVALVAHADERDQRLVGLEQRLRLRDRQRRRAGQLGIGGKFARDLRRGFIKRLLRTRAFGAKIRDQCVVPLAIGRAKFGRDALVQTVERGLEILLPAHDGRDRIVAGAEPRGHLRQRRARLRLMGALRGLEGLIPCGGVRPPIGDMPDRFDQSGVEVREALELRAVVAVGALRRSWRPTRAAASPAHPAICRHGCRRWRD